MAMRLFRMQWIDQSEKNSIPLFKAREPPFNVKVGPIGPIFNVINDWVF